MLRIVVFLLLSGPALAQTGVADGSIRGAIHDPSGSPVPTASVGVKNMNTGAYSERCRSAFRGDGDRDFELMPITIPR
jgi:hypothetical protein